MVIAWSSSETQMAIIQWPSPAIAFTTVSILRGVDARAIALLNGGAATVQYRGIHVNRHRVYAGSSASAGQKRAVMPPFVHVAHQKADGNVEHIYGFLIGVFGICDGDASSGSRGRRSSGSVSRDAARQPDAVVLHLRRYGKSRSPCPHCSWPYFTEYTQRGTETHAVVLRQGMVVEWLHVNASVTCAPPPSERGRRVLHKNPRVTTINSIFA
jgi:hypothetical protein